MDYKIELYLNKKPIYNNMLIGYSHPNQVVRKTLNELSKDINVKHMNIAVINGFGEVWLYALKKTNEGVQVWGTGKTLVNKNDIVSIFSGNKTIVEVI
jgi:hypothetical protein